MEENSQTVVDDTAERSVESCGYMILNQMFSGDRD
jgi:hypothetical protein